MIDATVVVGLRPDLARLTGELVAPRQWVARIGVDGLLGDLGAATLWLLAAWLLFALAVGWATLVPGAAGRIAARIGHRMLPGVLRRVLIGSAGLSVLVAPVAAGAATPSGLLAAHQTSVSARLAHAPMDGVGSSTPPPSWPQSPSTPHPGGHRAGDQPGGHRSTDSVTVRHGDSLWVIAQRRLGAHAGSRQIADEWPRWYAANRSVVGDDPALITPGQVLHAPSTSGTSAT